MTDGAYFRVRAIGVSGMRASFQETRSASIREDLAAGLARRTVFKAAIGEVDAPHRDTTHRARVTRAGVYGETRALGVFEFGRWLA